ncbi:glycosyltransferase family 2 protein [Psychroflexus sp. ALD_RP9]|uniref:glycosyltransferase family 2 protein n=1 Tax=Psychroflexus sp. ALD_RP9 TaxID=2777186 RepID=UPI001A8C5A86|nr:glycosyltransferase family 2 protein [Psychroflexus sp. ALD_RP9]QSS97607.1 glycosyltransferase family 2 protein [Psychroflexus sp. ALD_RP9]
MKLSIIILNYKVPYYLILCLDSVYKAIKGINAEVIVSDNNSKDDSLDLVKQYFPETICIANSKNLGFAKAYNQAVTQAKGKYLCILNPDTVIGENCFKELIHFKENTSNIGAIGTRLIDGKGKFLPESKRQIPTPKVAFKKLLGLKSNYYDTTNQAHENGITSILVGAFMFLEKKHYHAIDGFDERYFMYGEDIDFSYQLLEKGLDNYYYGKLTSIHFKGESTQKNKTYYKRFYGAMHLFYQKYYANPIINSVLKLTLNLLINIAPNKTKTKKITSKDKKALVITENQSQFNSVLKNFEEIKFSSQVVINKDSLREFNTIIFDASALSYQTIIEKMLSWQDLNLNYRIKPKQGSFCVGSDSNESQGEVLRL